MSGRKGFTLIELLVVIIIVGILAAVSVPIMRGNVDRARGTEGYAAAGAVRTAERLYHAEHSTYSACLTTLGLDVDDIGGQYYGKTANRVSISAGADTFSVNVIGYGDADGEWVAIDHDGTTSDSF